MWRRFVKEIVRNLYDNFMPIPRRYLQEMQAVEGAAPGKSPRAGPPNLSWKFRMDSGSFHESAQGCGLG